MKKILLLILILCFAVFLPIGKVDAVQESVYVGVQISTATAPGYGGATDEHWCLPAGSQLTIGSGCTRGNSGATCSPFSAVVASGNPSTSAYPVCEGGTIWSSLLNLNSGSNYVIKLSAYSFCPGATYAKSLGADCWVATPANEDCFAACHDHGLEPYTYNNDTGSWVYGDQGHPNCAYDDFSNNNCAMLKSLKGSACTNCYAASTYNYYDPATGNCYYTKSFGYTDCNEMPAGSGLVRACLCNDPGAGGTFYYPFTVPANVQ